MLPFKPKKQYTTIAVYTACTIALVILLAVSLFNAASIGAWFGDLFSSFSPLVYGFIFAYLLRPLVKRFEKLFWKLFKVERRETEKTAQRAIALAKGTAILASFLCVAVFLFCFVFFLVPLLVGDSAQLGRNLLHLATSSIDLINEIGAIFGFTFTSTDVTDFIISSRDTILSYAADFGAGFAVTVFEMIVGLCLSAGILFHRTALSARVRRIFVSLFPYRAVNYVSRVTKYSDGVVGKYLVGKIVECLIIGLLYLIVLPIIGCPYPFLITIIMTVTNFIPIIGAILGGIPSGILILTEIMRPGSDTRLWMLIVFIIIVLALEQIDGNIVFPRVIGSIIGLRPVWIMIAVALFGGLFGVIGMFLSVPIFSIVYMLLRDATNHRLAKKDMTQDTEYYSDLFATTAPPRKRAFKHHFFFGVHDKDGDDASKK